MRICDQNRVRGLESIRCNGYARVARAPTHTRRGATGYSVFLAKERSPGLPAPSGPLVIPARRQVTSRVLRTADGAAHEANVGPTVTWALQLSTHVPARKNNANIGLDLLVTSIDGKKTTAELQQIRPPQGYTHNDKEYLQRRTDFFIIKLPAGFEPAAVSINDKEDGGDIDFRKGGDFERLFIERITLTSESDSNKQLSFTANTYISVVQDWRLFVRDDAWSDKTLRSNPVIIELQENELKEIRGEGSNAEKAKEQRVPGDRIYRFATYNDLGKDSKEQDNIRQTLGGDQFPYPRRLETNRPPYPESANHTGPYESAPQASGVAEEWALGEDNPILRTLKNAVLKKALPSAWVPEDDNFDSDKTTGFVGGALLGVLPSVLISLEKALGGNPLLTPLADLLKSFGVDGESFKSFRDVLRLYDQDQLRGQHTGIGTSPSVLAKGDESNNNIRGVLDELQKNAAVKNSFDLRDAKPLSNAADGSPNGCIDLLKYEVPQSLYKRTYTWHTDKEFGRMFLAGMNPMIVEAVNTLEDLKRHLGDSAIKDTDISDALEGQTFESLVQGDKPRLFVVNYWGLAGLLREIKENNLPDYEGVQHAGRAVLFKNKDGNLMPVAIELAHYDAETGKTPSTVYTPKDGANIWLLAKFLFMSIDSSVHQLISHWLRTHACAEPYLISTRRQLSPTHPIFRLMLPHFRYTLPINAAARAQLVAADTVLEQCFTPGRYIMQLSSRIYQAGWQFKNEGLAADLRKRGFLQANDSSDLKAKLLLEDYPYAEDGLEIWTAMHEYFTDYVNHYYADDDEVTTDGQLTKWYSDIQTEGHPDAPKSAWIDLKGRASLVDICCTIAWVASAHHAAVNFGQYDYAGWMVTHASMCRRPAPAKDSREWKELASAGEFDAQKEILTYLSLPVVTTKVYTATKILSSHATDEHYLSSKEQAWLPLDNEPAVKDIFDKFVVKINQAEAAIEARNKAGAMGNKKYLSRNPAEGGMKYTLMLPSSEQGVTMRGVPYSISI